MLTSDLPIVKPRLTIRGPGVRRLTISNRTHGVHVFPGASISISNLTFTGSKSNSTSLLSNEGMLTLSNSIVSGNNGGFSGGGIYNNGGTLTLTNSTVLGNTAVRGGGLYNAGRFTIINSTVIGNTAVRGGGLYNLSGTLTVANSTVADNTATSTGSGGIDGSGGGIYSVDTLTLVNSTVSDNTAASKGGGIYNLGAQAEITFCTIYGNKTTDNGGGLSIEDYKDPNGIKKKDMSSQVSIRNSIVVGNLAPIAPTISGKLTSGGYNLIQDTSVAIFTPNQQHSTDISSDTFPNLGIDPMLRDNGGPTTPHTFTHALLSGSPAIDKIPLAACQVTINSTAITTDQRTMKRPDENEGACDIGAYESSP